ncbi:Nitroreductase [Agrocybe pediades]|nr:Nitroreductase [Agrocybe pediades]
MSSSETVSFLDAVKARRSFVAINKTSPIPDDRVISIIQDTIKHSPSAFNVQSCRALILFGAEHEKFWDLAAKKVKDTVPEAVFAGLEPKIKGHRDSYGSVLFFEDTEAVKKLPPQFQGVFSQYPEWYAHAQGMNQFVAWTALTAEGLGCSLQHYKPNAEVLAEWKLPQSWVLHAQLVFGTPTGPPRGGEKVFPSLEDKVLVRGA